MKEIKGKKLWKAYFWLITVATFAILIFAVFGEVEIFIEDNIFSNIYNFVFTVIGIFSLIGIYGFIYEKKCFYKELWMFFLIILVIEGISELISFFNYYQFFIIAGTYILSLPYYYALYKYAFKMNFIWSGEND